MTAEELRFHDWDELMREDRPRVGIWARKDQPLRTVEFYAEGQHALVSDGRILVVYHDDCAFCEEEKGMLSSFFPPHKASPNCKSGGHNHCACDTCF